MAEDETPHDVERRVGHLPLLAAQLGGAAVAAALVAAVLPVGVGAAAAEDPVGHRVTELAGVFADLFGNFQGFVQVQYIENLTMEFTMKISKRLKAGSFC